jgi:hypothetical protein
MTVVKSYELKSCPGAAGGLGWEGEKEKYTPILETFFFPFTPYTRHIQTIKFIPIGMINILKKLVKVNR